MILNSQRFIRPIIEWLVILPIILPDVHILIRKYWFFLGFFHILFNIKAIFLGYLIIAIIKIQLNLIGLFWLYFIVNYVKLILLFVEFKDKWGFIDWIFVSKGVLMQDMIFPVDWKLAGLVVVV